MKPNFLVYRFASAWREGVQQMIRRLAAIFIGSFLFGVLGWFGLARAQEGDERKALNMQNAPILPATQGVFGLYSAKDFRLVKGNCADCVTPKQNLWYFRDELVAVPTSSVKMADFTRGVAAQEDIRRWYQNAQAADLQARPALLWIGAPALMRDATLSEAGDAVRLADGSSVPFKVVPKIKTNLSYYNASSVAFLRQQPLRMRGEMQDGAWVARTIWPQNWKIDETQMKPAPLAANETIASLTRTHASAKDERFDTRLLWERIPGKNLEKNLRSTAARDWSGRAVIGIMLNGAQGDDDEAHGGHFAIVTGRFGNSAGNGSQGGDMADWMVNNFYNLDSYSEKGVIAAMLPMDNYMADLNSGQSWYRPSYMLVAVLKSDRAAYAYQGAMGRVYNHFYRHDFLYRHAGANCAGISMDTLRTLGWDIPRMGPTSVPKAIAAYPYKSIADMSFTSGKQAYDYMIEEKSRLYPAAAFDAATKELMRIAGVVNGAAGRANAGALEQILGEDIEALVFVRIPQIPSSRAFGSFPVSSFDEYMARVPEDKSQWKIVPVDARPFPPELIEADTLKDKSLPPWTPALAGLALVGGLLSLRSIRRNVHERRKRGIK